jgi:polyhydroxyalkanoate synthesis repressor PhaR
MADENIAAGGDLCLSSSLGQPACRLRKRPATRRKALTRLMTEQKPTTIKKYANRRLYDTGTSTYVTLEDLAAMVKRGEDFLVSDAKTGEDITRPVLTQIIFEQESKDGQSLLPISFLRQLIRFYGDSMQMLVPSYLEFSIDKFTRDQQKFRDQIDAALGSGPFGEPTRQAFHAMEEQTKKNMAVFRQALSIFNPFGVAMEGAGAVRHEDEEPAAPAQLTEVDELKRQIAELNQKVDKLTGGT